jgi:DNA-directed RNA polymerase subunit M/transcription elongation factor TFIIS
MAKFSPAGNLMLIKQVGEDFIFYCPKTNYTEKPTEKDYLAFHKDYTLKSSDFINEHTNLIPLINDVSIPKVKGKCESNKCKGKQVTLTQIRNKDLSVINVCHSCHSFWKY